MELAKASLLFKKRHFTHQHLLNRVRLLNKLLIPNQDKTSMPLQAPNDLDVTPPKAQRGPIPIRSVSVFTGNDITWVAQHGQDVKLLVHQQTRTHYIQIDR